MSLLLAKLARFAARRVAFDPRTRDMATKVAKGVAEEAKNVAAEAKRVAGEKDRLRAAGESLRRIAGRLKGSGESP